MRIKLSLLTLIVLLAIACGTHEARLDWQDWQRYRREFIQDSGRIIDTGNRNISHSEGQGYGMLLAESAGDRATFARIWRWTQENLQVRGDGLFAWKWVPSVSNPIPDRNNATDGDLLITWALIRAASRWQDSDYLRQAQTIARSIKHTLVRPSAYGPVLLAGSEGFVKPKGLVVNLSYWIFPALNALHTIDPDLIWPQILESGRRLLRAARFGKAQLPPDWLQLSDGLALAEGFAPRFGFDALRIPLYLCWAGYNAELAVEEISDFWGAYKDPGPPAWIDLSDGRAAGYSLSTGALQVAAYVEDCAANWTRRSAQAKWQKKADYYSSTLYLLSKLARSESGQSRIGLKFLKLLPNRAL